MSHVISMTATINVRLTGSAKTAATVAKRAARLDATKVRMAQRVDKAKARIERAEELLRKAQERLTAANEKGHAIADYAEALLAKQTTELQAAEQFHTVTVKREQEKGQNHVVKVKSITPVGTVEAEDGKKYDLTKEAVKVIKTIVGRKQGGVFSPVSGYEATTIISLVDGIAGHHVGDTFQVTMKDRKNGIMFTIEDDGLHFATV